VKIGIVGKCRVNQSKYVFLLEFLALNFRTRTVAFYSYMSWLSIVKNLDFSEVICLSDQITVSLLIRFESEPVSVTYYTVNYALSIIFPVTFSCKDCVVSVSEHKFCLNLGLT